MKVIEANASYRVLVMLDVPDDAEVEVYRYGKSDRKMRVHRAYLTFNGSGKVERVPALSVNRAHFYGQRINKGGKLGAEVEREEYASKWDFEENRGTLGSKYPKWMRDQFADAEAAANEHIRQ